MEDIIGTENKINLMKNVTPSDLWHKYNKCVDYNTGINLYDIVNNNEDYYNSDQWRKCNAPDLQKITMNYIDKVVNYFISTITADNIGTNIKMYRTDIEENKMLPNILSSEIVRIMENTQFKDMLRNSTRDCCVDADSALYSYFNTDIKINGQEYEGDIDLELIKNTTIYFGNPTKDNAQKQPFIIISMRRTLEKVKEEAEENGLNPDNIKADSDTNQYESEHEPDNFVTQIVYFEKKKGSVWCAKSTIDSWIKEPWDTEYSLYPISYWSWKTKPNSYHGISPVTSQISNQDAVNKLYSFQYHTIQNLAFPKIIYDYTKFGNNKYNNKVGQAIGVNGNPNEAIFSVFNGVNIKSEITQFADSIMSNAKELMGASTVALGDIKNPDNTSAIVAVNQASRQPLNLQQKSYYKFVEDNLRIWLDMISVNYGEREVKTTNEDGNDIYIMYNFDNLKNINFKLSIDISAASWWNELAQQQTLDNLYENQILTNKILYVESISSNALPNKSEIIADLKKQQAQLEDKTAQYEAMAKFIETLPPEQQAQLKSLPDNQMEQQVMAMMQQSQQISQAV